MTRGSHIASVGPGDSPAEPHSETTELVADTALELDEVYEEEGKPSRRSRAWIMPTLAVLAVLGWSAFFGFAHQSELFDGLTPLEGSNLATQWAVPVLLVVGLWLLAMRSSRREAVRFGEVARSLQDESARLEARLVTVNRELSLARDFVAAQSRDLESLGRVASERLSENAERMSALIHENSAQIESIASVSSVALQNMDKLRDDLPVVANSARDVTSQIGNAGRTAKTQLDELIAGLHRVNTFGEAGTKLIAGLQDKIDEALAKFEARAKSLGDTTIEVIVSLGQRIASLEVECRDFTQSVHDSEGEALEKWRAAIETMRTTLADALREITEIDESALERTRGRLEAIGEWAKKIDRETEERTAGLIQALDTRREAHGVREAEETAALEKRLAELDSVVAQRQEAQLTHIEGLAKRGESLSAAFDEIEARMEAISARGTRVGGELSQAIELLSVRLNSNKDVLDATDRAVAGLTDASVRLLELIQAGSQHSREELPAAIEAAEERLSDFEARSRELSAMLGEAAEKGAMLSNHVTTAQATGKALLGEFEALHASLTGHEASHAERIEGLRSALAALGEESEKLSERAGGELSEAVEKLQGALRGALDELGSGPGSAIDGLSERIGEQSAEAIERVIRLRATEVLGELEQAAAHANGVGREAARQLRDQLAKVDELAGNLESRVAQARERAEEQVDNDFARRVALITESLNSNAIDISKAMSNDVTDTAWASYLRGDRGIFTRRAVRLLDNSEAREIAEIYDRDHDFREHVSRYIHDFEAMLRTMLSTRDGHALGVTLLSSDMGKLYVALAQAIDRLRD